MNDWRKTSWNIGGYLQRNRFLKKRILIFACCWIIKKKHRLNWLRAKFKGGKREQECVFCICVNSQWIIRGGGDWMVTPPMLLPPLLLLDVGTALACSATAQGCRLCKALSDATVWLWRTWWPGGGEVERVLAWWEPPAEGGGGGWGGGAVIEGVAPLLLLLW